jgi:hypothetical protein
MYFIFKLIYSYFYPTTHILHLIFYSHIFYFFINVLFKHCICNQSLDCMGNQLFFIVPIVEKKLFVMLCGKKNDFPRCYLRCFSVYYKKCKISRSTWVHPYFFSLAFVFTSMGRVWF